MPCGAHFPSSKKKQFSFSLESAGRKEMGLLQGTTGQLQEKGQPSTQRAKPLSGCPQWSMKAKAPNS